MAGETIKKINLQLLYKQTWKMIFCLLFYDHKNIFYLQIMISSYEGSRHISKRRQPYGCLLLVYREVEISNFHIFLTHKVQLQRSFVKRSLRAAIDAQIAVKKDETVL